MANIEITDQGGGGGGGSGTVTSVGLTTGTTGTNVNVSNSPITTSGSIVLNIPTASATNTGKLSNTDWTTFNNKGSVSSVGLTSSTLTITGSPITTTGSFTAEIPDGFLKVGTGLTSSLQNLVDTNGTASTLWLSTTLIQSKSTLQITTQDNPYIDAEDGTGNNRFTIGRDPSSQQVNVDFASNPTGSTTIVGGIRTYKDGVNLATTMVFREDGNIGIGETTSPSGLLHVDGGANIPRIILDADTNVARIFSFRTNDTQRWAFRIDDNETGSNAGSNFAIRRYNDAGTFIDSPITIARDTGKTTINKGLDLNGSALTNFVPNLPSTAVNLNITSANYNFYNGAVLSVAGAITITIDNTVPQGFTCTMIQQDANQATVAAGTGLTLRNRQGHTKLNGQWAVVSVVVSSTNLILGGDTAA